MRLERQLPFSASMSRSVPVISWVVRTIMYEILSIAQISAESGVEDLCGGLPEDGQTLIEFLVGDGERRQQLHDLVGRTRRLGQEASVVRKPTHLGGRVG